MFLLMWIKILTYLAVFKKTRYLIKMIIEIIGEITTFLFILFIAILAYAQILYTTKDTDSEETSTARGSFLLAFGELGDFESIGLVQFLIFALFLFFIPLVLMNMLIAIMSDAYERVQSNAQSADSKILADMILEMEELTRFFKNKFGSGIDDEAKQYMIFSRTRESSGSGGEGWEGMTGELKICMKRVQSNIIASIESVKEELHAKQE